MVSDSKSATATGLLALLILAPLPATVAANAIDLPRTDLEIRIDGILDEEAWEGATRIELDTETWPGENIPAPVKTVAYLLEDGKNLYVAFDAQDPNPRAIRAYLRDRDSAYDDDFVGIVLDTY